MSSRFAFAVLSIGLGFVPAKGFAHPVPTLSLVSGPEQSLGSSSVGGRGASGATATAAGSNEGAPPIEVVALREAGEYVLYIDDYASNAPIDGLQVDLRLGGRRLRALPLQDGRYRVPADLLDGEPAGESSVVVTGATLDLSLPLDLRAAADEPGVAGIHRAVASSSSSRRLAGFAAIIGVVSIAIALIRHRRQRARQPPSQQPA